ncbi:MAG: hypothetical protein COY38_04625 [Candidatus Aenigmarchaeota archaeon CG_4_10_14_0_8_um_filter_37_24]|nr:hypothetical protein [Candidatus Aenigmarchaeota archaeon]OIN88009.1 MAG: hypothetical protein AUJ50_01975 [Candidatus Aenigmarchaeota archaeon CG1_02_38_14]OIP34485.1 MAG: hypothetical protein AUK23_01605 [Deltaproteobacteria bacterium CG2_30_43_15]PIV69558.1 MAG: hypothetical protein COS07_00350 [Candidatus Aenigmarchaeota archaeon CG01_land_8_20_14_3_00_37_9]PIW41634.1 MAG: hypothetical protein COW21_00910 [Candidatus Aenigmarchaeota archaeon CG15_BIG_FIL_POST_REV_8_21_14_020_37_27]PIX50
MGNIYDWRNFDAGCRGFERRLSELDKQHSEDWILELRRYGEFIKSIEGSVPDDYRDNFLHAKGMAGLKK